MLGMKLFFLVRRHCYCETSTRRRGFVMCLGLFNRVSRSKSGGSEALYPPREAWSPHVLRPRTMPDPAERR